MSEKLLNTISLFCKSIVALSLVFLFLQMNVIIPSLDIENTPFELVDLENEESEESNEKEDKKEKEDEQFISVGLNLKNLNHDKLIKYAYNKNDMLDNYCEVFTPPPELA